MFKEFIIQKLEETGEQISDEDKQNCHTTILKFRLLQAWNVTNAIGCRLEGKPKLNITSQTNTIVSDVTLDPKLVSPESRKKKKTKNRLTTFQELVSKLQGRNFKVWGCGDVIKYPRLDNGNEYLMTFKLDGLHSFLIKGQDKGLKKQKIPLQDAYQIVGVARTFKQKEANYRIFTDQYCKQFGLFHESSSDDSSRLSVDDGSVLSVKAGNKKSVRKILRNSDSEETENEESSQSEVTNGT